MKATHSDSLRLKNGPHRSPSRTPEGGTNVNIFTSFLWPRFIWQNNTLQGVRMTLGLNVSLTGLLCMCVYVLVSTNSLARRNTYSLRLFDFFCPALSFFIHFHQSITSQLSHALCYFHWHFLIFFVPSLPEFEFLSHFLISPSWSSVSVSLAFSLH